MPSRLTMAGAPVPMVTDCSRHRLWPNMCLRGGVKAVGRIPPVKNKAGRAARGGNGDGARGKGETDNRRKKSGFEASGAGVAKKKAVRGKAGFRASMHRSKMQYLAPRGRENALKKSSRDARDARRSAAGAQVATKEA